MAGTGVGRYAGGVRTWEWAAKVWHASAGNRARAQRGQVLHGSSGKRRVGDFAAWKHKVPVCGSRLIGCSTD